MARMSFRHRAIALIMASMLATAPLSACGVFGNTFTSPQEEPAGLAVSEDDGKYLTGEGEYMSAPSANAMDSAYEMGYTDVEMVDWNTEEYAPVDEGGFILSATRPLSTVSADVDTASWCNLRRMVREGYTLSSVERKDDEATWGGYDMTIPSVAVRIEEMLNYFDYDYAAPKAGERFSVTTNLGPCPWNDKTELLTLGFATADEDIASDKGRNLVFLIDVSGSMDSRDKLDLLQDSFKELVKQLDEKDRISVVTYASNEELVLDGVPGDNKKEITRAINRLHADGSTNGERGLEMAYEVAERNYIEGGVNRIVMASDGDLNVG
ncbi:MAG: von Willebrand factor type A domain-containing protein, partial [Atopobiaceae bacterium]|nr:von Willebrand factor type A domain-containing protein [Atopobiaceae bacterium]